MLKKTIQIIDFKSELYEFKLLYIHTYLLLVLDLQFIYVYMYVTNL